MYHFNLHSQASWTFWKSNGSGTTAKYPLEACGTSAKRETQDGTWTTPHLALRISGKLLRFISSHSEDQGGI